MASDRHWSLIEGVHPVLPACKAGRRKREIIVRDGGRPRRHKEMEQWAKKRNVPVHRLDREAFSKKVRTAVPQGVAAYARPWDYVPLDQIVREEPDDSALLLICDGIVDPHNL